jgi:uncharacterized protein
MQQFIYRIHPTRPEMLTVGPTASEASAVGDHFSYLERLTTAGVVLLAGRTLTSDDRTFGIVVFAAESEEEAAAVVQKDPAVERGVMKAELFPFRVALLSQNWAGYRGNEPIQPPQSPTLSVTPAAGQEERQPYSADHL